MDGPGMDPGWSRDGPGIDPGWTRDGPGVSPGRTWDIHNTFISYSIILIETFVHCPWSYKLIFYKVAGSLSLDNLVYLFICVFSKLFLKILSQPTVFDGFFSY